MLRSLVGSEMCIRDRVSTQSTGVAFFTQMEPTSLQDILVPCPVHGCNVRTKVGKVQDDHIRTHLCQSAGEKLVYHVRHHSDLYLHKIVPGYASLSVPRFLVHMLTGTGRGVRKHVSQPTALRERFMRQIGECWWMLPDPGKMKKVPKREEDLAMAVEDGFVWTAWWIHPELMAQSWWQDEPVRGPIYDEPPPTAVGFDFSESSVSKPDGWLYTYRELTTEHLPMLRELEAGITSFCQDNLGVDMQQVQIWTHNPVSEAYSTLHIKVHYKRPQDDRYLGRSILLCDLMRNLECFGDAFGPARIQDFWLGHQFILTLRRSTQPSTLTLTPS
eukprot:TRINITY_DN5776_c0_g2_i2.p1 TRINITY_DN5776_c0_g2~~TRINITY_DN5776_c0_g2_i2.p1  ORF type:complete len:330 (+),score=64.43 TRINITY_DN5776_c0_g2_i2:155-1144(+)